MWKHFHGIFFLFSFHLENFFYFKTQDLKFISPIKSGQVNMTKCLLSRQPFAVNDCQHVFTHYWIARYVHVSKPTISDKFIESTKKKRSTEWSEEEKWLTPKGGLPCISQWLGMTYIYLLTLRHPAFPLLQGRGEILHDRAPWSRFSGHCRARQLRRWIYR